MIKELENLTIDELMALRYYTDETSTKNIDDTIFIRTGIKFNEYDFDEFEKFEKSVSKGIKIGENIRNALQAISLVLIIAAMIKYLFFT